MSRFITFTSDEYYHLYNRGVDKRNVFTSKKEYERFLALLYLCNTEESVRANDKKNFSFSELLSVQRNELLVKICVYCLMPNHFHLLIQEIVENGISRFMQKLLTGYTMYFNTKHERSGSLFEGTFKARHIHNERYLSHVVSYIHLNPVKLIEPRWKETGIADRKAAKQYLENYRYSSFLDYTKPQQERARIESNILSPEALSHYFQNATDFERTIAEWLNYNPEYEQNRKV